MPVYERSIPVHPLHRSPVLFRDRPFSAEERAHHDSEDVCGVILAGSHAWGETPLDRLLRSPLVPVAQTPIIHHAIDWLRRARLRHAMVCANAWTAAVRDCLGDGESLGLSIRYFEDHEPRGSAGCAHDAARRSHAGTFVVVDGCMIPLVDLTALLAAHRESRAAATVVVEVERRARGGGPRLAPQGAIYVFDRRALEMVPERGHHDLRSALVDRLRDAGEKVLVYEVHGIAPRVVDQESYGSVSQWLIPRAVEQPHFLPGYGRRGSALVHPMAYVAPTARLLGPVIVGPGTRIEDHAVIVGPVSIGMRARIGHHVSVSRTALWDECTVGGGASLDACLLADGATVADGEQLIGEVRAPRPLAPRRRVSWLSPAPSLAREMLRAAAVAGVVASLP